MWLLSILSSFATLTSVYCTYERSDSSCSALIYGCITDSTCSSFYDNYVKNCEEELDNVNTNSCKRKCKRALKALFNNPVYSYERFHGCECQGDAEFLCVKQKCKLIASCMGDECMDELTATTPPPDNRQIYSTFSSTPSGHSITMSSSTVALGKVNCETVIAHCEKKGECRVLLKERDVVCSQYTMSNEFCSAECERGNQLLRENFVGKHMATCKFETPTLDTMLFTSLIAACVPRAEQTQSPTHNTSPPSRPIGDCKREFIDCQNDGSCNFRYNNLMRECKRKVHANGVQLVSTCTATCRDELVKFKALEMGEALLDCGCTGHHVSRRCEQIKYTFNDICTSEPCSDVWSTSQCMQCVSNSTCNSDCGLLCKKSCGRCSTSTISEPTTNGMIPLSTHDESVPTTPPTGYLTIKTPATKPPIKRPISNFFHVNVTCADGMNVRIDYSAEIDYSPHFAAEDKSCEVVAYPPESRTATLRLQYNPPNCGTKIVEPAPYPHDSVYRIRNRIYVRSVDDQSYNSIADIECRIPVKRMREIKRESETKGETSAAMTFYSDNLFSREFESYGNVTEDAVLYLGGNKTVYVELAVNNSNTFVLESCYATPNGKKDYSSPHFFIKNGCKLDGTFNMFDFEYEPSNRTRFSFYRIMFSDSKFSGRVYVHCNVSLCEKTDPGCRIHCREDEDDEMKKFRKLAVSHGPYTFALASSRVSRTKHATLLLTLTSVLVLTRR